MSKRSIVVLVALAFIVVVGGGHLTEKFYTEPEVWFFWPLFFVVSFSLLAFIVTLSRSYFKRKPGNEWLRIGLFVLGLGLVVLLSILIAKGDSGDSSFLVWPSPDGDSRTINSLGSTVALCCLVLVAAGALIAGWSFVLEAGDPETREKKKLVAALAAVGIVALVGTGWLLFFSGSPYRERCEREAAIETYPEGDDYERIVEACIEISEFYEDEGVR